MTCVDVSERVGLVAGALVTLYQFDLWRGQLETGQLRLVAWVLHACVTPTRKTPCSGPEGASLDGSLSRTACFIAGRTLGRVAAREGTAGSLCLILPGPPVSYFPRLVLVCILCRNNHDDAHRSFPQPSASRHPR